MNFQKDIAEAYSKLNLIPLNGQDKAVDRILTEFFINKKQNVILSADTGTGKSIIGAVVAKVFAEKFQDEKNAFILMHTNSLVEQYSKTFQAFPESEFFQIKGANTYTCEAARALTNEPEATAESCMKNKLDDAFVREYCSECEFAVSRKFVNTTENLITNYSYYFVSKMWSKHLDDRTLTIFDEGHTINDIFAEHNAIHFTEDKLDACIKECEANYSIGVKDAIHNFILVKNYLKAGKITESNYKTVLDKLYKAYRDVADYTKNLAANQNFDMSIKTQKIHKKYYGLGCKIGDFKAYNYDHVFDKSEDGKEISVKPIFVGSMSKMLLGRHNLFMSATISDEFMKTTLGLDSNSIGYVKLDPVYDPKNKEVVMCPVGSLNYEAMKNPKIISSIKNSIKIITDDHGKQQKQKGLILVPSFFLGNQIANTLSGIKVFNHQSGIKLDKLIREFKEFKGAAVLISPSIFEGLDFADDHSRYQIIVKAPFPSLGEKRMKEIATRYPNVYKIITLKKIVQGIGRSVRSSNDWATTYILDKNAELLFNGNLNVWKNQFNIV